MSTSSFSALSALMSKFNPPQTQNSDRQDTQKRSENSGWKEVGDALSALTASLASGSELQTEETPLSAAEIDTFERELQDLSEDQLKSNVTAQLKFCRQLSEDMGQPGVNRILTQCEKARTDSQGGRRLGELNRIVADCYIALSASNVNSTVTAIKGDLNADKLIANVLDSCLTEQVPWTTTEILLVAFTIGLYALVGGGVAWRLWCERRERQAREGRDDRDLAEEESRLLMGPQDLAMEPTAGSGSL